VSRVVGGICEGVLCRLCGAFGVSLVRGVLNKFWAEFGKDSEACVSGRL